MPSAFIISTGSELLNGSKNDSNGQFLAFELSGMGFSVLGSIVAGDEYSGLESSFHSGLAIADLVISSGGLGPTFDDLTREAASRALGLELEFYPRAMAEIEAFFVSLGRKMPDSNRRQAYLPQGAHVLKNHGGTAPGVFLKHEGKTVVLLPGPPGEMQMMFEREVKPRLFRAFGQRLQPPVQRVVKIFGLGESQVEERLQDLLLSVEDGQKGILAQDTEVIIKLQARDQVRAAALDELVAKIFERLPGYAYADRMDESLAGRVIGLLRDRGQSLALAESCTGGLTARMLTDIAGASQVFWGSIVSYSNDAKLKCLGVDFAVLSSQGAVSEMVARQMSQGVKSLSGADWALSITGIAGPGGGSTAKPVGLVYIACEGPGVTQVKAFQFRGDRERIRSLSARNALAMLMRQLIKQAGQ